MFTKEFEALAKKLGMDAGQLAKSYLQGVNEAKWQGKTFPIYQGDVPKPKPEDKVPVDKGITELQFWTKAIRTLRSEGYKGLNPAFSGANGAFRKHFAGRDPVESVKALCEDGKLIAIPYRGKLGKKGGVVIYLPEDAPARSAYDPEKRGADALAKILAD